MRIALLAPLPPEKNGIADYANHFRTALEHLGVTVLTPLTGVAGNSEAIKQAIGAFDWQSVDLVHAELGGGRLGEFLALRELRKAYPRLPLTATVHDPERIVWRREHLPFPLNLMERLPSPLPQAAVVLADPLTLREERQVAKGLTRLVTLTRLGADCLSQRMQLPSGKVAVINHANLPIPPAPLPALDTLRLLYFGFIYRGKGIEDLVQALADVFKHAPELRDRVRLTLAGGTAAEMAFGAGGNYLEQLNAQIAALGLTDAIDWRLNLPADEIAQTIQAHHVMVLPYRESKNSACWGASAAPVARCLGPPPADAARSPPMRVHLPRKSPAVTVRSTPRVMWPRSANNCCGWHVHRCWPGIGPNAPAKSAANGCGR